MAGDKLHVEGRSGISLHEHAERGSFGARRPDVYSTGRIDLQATAGEQSAALYQLLDEVFAGLYE